MTAVVIEGSEHLKCCYVLFQYHSWQKRQAKENRRRNLKARSAGSEYSFFTFIQNETKEVIFLSNIHLQSFKCSFNNLSDNVIVDLNYLSMKKNGFKCYVLFSWQMTLKIPHLVTWSGYICLVSSSYRCDSSHELKMPKLYLLRLWTVRRVQQLQIQRQ